jgi:hypothetical protein
MKLGTKGTATGLAVVGENNIVGDKVVGAGDGIDEGSVLGKVDGAAIGMLLGCIDGCSVGPLLG